MASPSWHDLASPSNSSVSEDADQLKKHPDARPVNSQCVDETYTHETESDDCPPFEGESTGEYLERLSRYLMETNVNMRNPQHPVNTKHVYHDLRRKHDTLPKVNSRADHDDTLKQHVDSQPQLRATFLNHSSDVDDSRGRATVYLWFQLTGLAHGMEREVMAVLSWERRQGVVSNLIGERVTSSRWLLRGVTLSLNHIYCNLRHADHFTLHFQWMVMKHTGMRGPSWFG